VAKLHKLYVLPAYQGRGLGTRLLAEAMGRARAAGFGRMVLQVNRYNAGAIGVYRRNGFAVLEEKRTDIGGGFVMDDFVMGRAL
jgi:ribosomal protein S18 acetylase RimI-like enzyme